MGEKLPWFAFYSRDWTSDPDLAQTSIGTRGIWIECLAAMHTAGQISVSGTLEGLARLGRCQVSDIERFLEENAELHFADVTECNGRYTVISRRFVRDAQERENNREKVRRHRARHTSARSDVTECNQNETAKTENVTLYDSVSDCNSESLSVSSESEGDPARIVESSAGRRGDPNAGEAIPPRAGDEKACATDSPPPAVMLETGPDFDAFWAGYPRKDGKSDARKAWGGLTPEQRAKALADVPLRLAANWADRPLDKFPHAATYLNQRRWEDELQTHLPVVRAGPVLSPGMANLARIIETERAKKRDGLGTDGAVGRASEGHLAGAIRRRCDGGGMA